MFFFHRCKPWTHNQVDTFKRRRAAELKHGRICALEVVTGATLNWVVWFKSCPPLSTSAISWQRISVVCFYQNSMSRPLTRLIPNSMPCYVLPRHVGLRVLAKLVSKPKTTERCKIVWSHAAWHPEQFLWNTWTVGHMRLATSCQSTSAGPATCPLRRASSLLTCLMALQQSPRRVRSTDSKSWPLGVSMNVLQWWLV